MISAWRYVDEKRRGRRRRIIEEKEEGEEKKIKKRWKKKRRRRRRRRIKRGKGGGRRRRKPNLVEYVTRRYIIHRGLQTSLTLRGIQSKSMYIFLIQISHAVQNIRLCVVLKLKRVVLLFHV